MPSPLSGYAPDRILELGFLATEKTNTKNEPLNDYNKKLRANKLALLYELKSIIQPSLAMRFVFQNSLLQGADVSKICQENP